MQTSMFKPFKRHDIAALKARLDLREVAEKVIGPAVKRNAKYSTFKAPDRDERTASLQVWRDGFKDFGSGEKGGDLFVFLERYAGLSFKEVLEQYDPDGGILDFGTLANTRNNRGAQVTPIQATRTPPAAEAAFVRWQTIARGLLTASQECLQTNLSVQKHLVSLGYTPETISARGLGYNPDWRKIELSGPDDVLWLPPGIVYPWLVDDQPYAIKVRCPYEKNGAPDALAQLMKMQPQKAKYMHVRGGRGSDAWYGALTDPSLPTIFVEGEKDCDMLFQAIGDRVNVVTVGSATGVLPTALTDHLQQAQWVAVVLDNDRAGRDNTLRLRDMLEKALAGSNVYVLDHYIDIEHKDIADWLAAGGDARHWLEELGNRAWKTAAQQVWRHDLNATVFPQGTPDVIRQMLLGMHNLSPHGKRFIQDHANAAMVYDLIQAAMLRQHITSPFTLNELKSAATTFGAQPDDSSTRRGLEQLLALGFLSESQPIPSLDIDLGGNTDEKSFKAKPKGRGRPARTYYVVPLRTALPSLLGHLERRLREALYADVLPANVEPCWFVDVLDEAAATELALLLEESSAELYATYLNERQAVEGQIRQQMAAWRKSLNLLSLDESPSTPLLYDQFLVTSGRDFRDGLYGSMIVAENSRRQVPRAETARVLGVDYKTVGAMRKRLGVVADPDFEVIALDEPVTDVCTLADSRASWAAGREYGRYLESSNGECIRLDKDDPTAMNEWVKRHQMTGGEVHIKIQVASIERFGTPEELLIQMADELFGYACGTPLAAPAGVVSESSSVSSSVSSTESSTEPETMLPEDTHAEPERVVPIRYSRVFVAAQLALRGEQLRQLATRIRAVAERYAQEESGQRYE